MIVTYLSGLTCWLNQVVIVVLLTLLFVGLVWCQALFTYHNSVHHMANPEGVLG